MNERVAPDLDPSHPPPIPLALAYPVADPDADSDGDGVRDGLDPSFWASTPSPRPSAIGYGASTTCGRGQNVGVRMIADEVSSLDKTDDRLLRLANGSDVPHPAYFEGDRSRPGTAKGDWGAPLLWEYPDGLRVVGTTDASVDDLCDEAFYSHLHPEVQPMVVAFLDPDQDGFQRGELDAREADGTLRAGIRGPRWGRPLPRALRRRHRTPAADRQRQLPGPREPRSGRRGLRRDRRRLRSLPVEGGAEHLAPRHALAGAGDLRQPRDGRDRGGSPAGPTGTETASSPPATTAAASRTSIRPIATATASATPASPTGIGTAIRTTSTTAPGGPTRSS